MAKRIARGDYSPFVLLYSRGLDTGFGLGVAGVVAPRIEPGAVKHPVDSLWGLAVNVKILAFRGAGRWGHLSLWDVTVCPLGYSEDPAFSCAFVSSASSRCVL